MNKTKYYCLLPLMLMAIVMAAMTACSENDTEENDFPNWKETNDKYFDQLYTATTTNIMLGDKSWKIIKDWTLDSITASHTYDHVIAHVLTDGQSGVRPFYGDSVRIHYSGRLIPTEKYTGGYQFDKSWTGEFNEATAVPSQMLVSNSALVPGFVTTLQNMHLGDKWEVYIPYQFGYDSSAQGSVPAYSTLVFTIELVGVYRNGADVPSWKSKDNRHQDMWDEE